MPRLFEKFYRADDPAVRRTSGTGLGLYIVRSLVTMLGGQVHVRSRVGKGTVFTVILPRAETVARPRSRVAALAH
jgi:signal transduction histidine kinase